MDNECSMAEMKSPSQNNGFQSRATESLDLALDFIGNESNCLQKWFYSTSSLLYITNLMEEQFWNRKIFYCLGGLKLTNICWLAWPDLVCKNLIKETWRSTHLCKGTFAHAAPKLPQKGVRIVSSIYYFPWLVTLSHFTWSIWKYLSISKTNLCNRWQIIRLSKSLKRCKTKLIGGLQSHWLFIWAWHSAETMLRRKRILAWVIFWGIRGP